MSEPIRSPCAQCSGTDTAYECARGQCYAEHMMEQQELREREEYEREQMEMEKVKPATPILDDTGLDRLHPLSGPLIDLRQVIHPLTQQGEDRIWRAAEKACGLIDKAEAEREQMRLKLLALSADNARLREALLRMRQLLRGLQPALNVMAREVLDDIIAEQIDQALSNPPTIRMQKGDK